MNASTAKKTTPTENNTKPASEKLQTVAENIKVSPDLKTEKLTYVLEMLHELRKLSATLDERMVAYLIEMAILETNTALNVQEFGSELGGRSRKNRDLR